MERDGTGMSQPKLPNDRKKTTSDATAPLGEKVSERRSFLRVTVICLSTGERSRGKRLFGQSRKSGESGKSYSLSEKETRVHSSDNFDGFFSSRLKPLPPLRASLYANEERASKNFIPETKFPRAFHLRKAVCFF